MAGEFKPWPKSHNGTREVLDKDALRDQYLDNPHYEWYEFCRDNGYTTSKSSTVNFPIGAWKKKWIEINSRNIEDKHIPKALSVKEFVIESRLQFPQEWNQMAANLKAVGAAVLHREMKFLQRDKEHEAEILEGKKKPLSKFGAAGLSFLSKAMKDIQELQKNALLMATNDQYQHIIPFKGSDPEMLDAEAEGERLRDIETQITNADTLTDENVTRIMNHWYDQMQEGQDIKTEDLGPIDLPLTPLEEIP